MGPRGGKIDSAFSEGAVRLVSFLSFSFLLEVGQSVSKAGTDRVERATERNCGEA